MEIKWACKLVAYAMPVFASCMLLLGLAFVPPQPSELQHSVQHPALPLLSLNTLGDSYPEFTEQLLRKNVTSSLLPQLTDF